MDHNHPDACYICGRENHPPTFSHRFWSNADAQLEFGKDRPEPEGSPEARYVEQHRPY